MLPLVEQCVKYLRETLGVAAAPAPWKGDAQLPFYLKKQYGFFEFGVLGAQVLLMLDDGGERTPGAIGKHVAQVRAAWGGEVVYVREAVTAYNRKRLIERAVPFIVPGKQMYLPTLGLDLREHFRKLRAKARKFSPATQVLFVYLLLHGKEMDISTGVTPGGMSKRLGYSAITMTRAFDEIEAAKIGACALKGRERVLAFQGETKGLWKEAQPFLRTPVAKHIWGKAQGADAPGLSAGLSALAHYTALAEPPAPVFAVSRAAWRALVEEGRVLEIPYDDPGAVEIQIWRYAPDICARGPVVDRLSLYLSLRDDPDERVDVALEEMLEVLEW